MDGMRISELAQQGGHVGPECTQEFKFPAPDIK